MMRKIIKIFSHLLIIVTFSLLIFTKGVSSQEVSEPTFDKAYKDYSESLEQYRQAHEEYLLARSQYLQFKTLKSKSDAQEKTANMLMARDEVVIRYLIILRSRLKDALGTTDEKLLNLNLQIDTEINWFEGHKKNLRSAGTLEDLVSDSDEAKDRFEKDEVVFYEVLSNVSSGKVINFRKRMNEIFSNLKAKLSEIYSADDPEYKLSAEKIATIDRWILEVEGRIVRSEEAQLEADDLLSKLQKLMRIDNFTYGEIISVLGQSNQYLKESSSFIREILREVKTAEL